MRAGDPPRAISSGSARSISVMKSSTLNRPASSISAWISLSRASSGTSAASLAIVSARPLMACAFARS